MERKIQVTLSYLGRADSFLTGNGRHVRRTVHSTEGGAIGAFGALLLGILKKS